MQATYDEMDEAERTMHRLVSGLYSREIERLLAGCPCVRPATAVNQHVEPR